MIQNPHTDVPIKFKHFMIAYSKENNTIEIWVKWRIYSLVGNFCEAEICVHKHYVTRLFANMRRMFIN